MLVLIENIFYFKVFCFTPLLVEFQPLLVDLILRELLAAVLQLRLLLLQEYLALTLPVLLSGSPVVLPAGRARQPFLA